MTSVSLLAASLKRQLKQPQETSEFVLVYAAYLVTAKKALPTDFHPEMNIRSSLTSPQFLPNLYTYLYSAVHKGRHITIFVTKAILPN